MTWWMTLALAFAAGVLSGWLFRTSRTQGRFGLRLASAVALGAAAWLVATLPLDALFLVLAMGGISLGVVFGMSDVLDPTRPGAHEDLP